MQNPSLPLPLVLNSQVVRVRLVSVCINMYFLLVLFSVMLNVLEAGQEGAGDKRIKGWSKSCEQR